MFMSVPDTLPSKVCISAHFLRSAHLRLSGDFQKVFANKTNVVGRLMVVWLLPRPQDSGIRLGVVASKRTFRRAVDRNRAKRLLREAFRLNQTKISSDADLVIIARRPILRAKCADVEREFIWLLKKAGLGAAQSAKSESGASGGSG
jgi:ribonuclease P protein component